LHTPSVIGRSVIAASAIALAFGAAGASERWLELKTEHFRILSNASAGKTTEIGSSLEAFRAVVARSTKGLTLGPDVPTTMFIFKDDASFDPYKYRPDRENSRLLGFFFPAVERQIIALNATPPENVNFARAFKQFQYSYAPVYHEYTHSLLRNTFSQLPLWLNEGIAEYFSTLLVQGRNADVGRADRAELPWLQQRFVIPIDKLMAIPRFDVLPGNTEATARAESWAVVHALLRGKDERRRQFSQFLSLLLAGTPQSEAFSKSFPVSIAELQAEVEAHVRQGEFSVPTYTLDELGVAREYEITTVDSTEMNIELGELVALTRSDRLDVAEERFRAALATKPNSPRALAGLGRVEQSRGHVERAEELFRKALVEAPEDPIVSFRLGSVLLGKVDETMDPAPPGLSLPPRVAEARALFAAAVRARPDLVVAQRFFGETFLVDPGDRSAGVAALETVLRTDPRSWRAASALGRLRLWSGDLAGAAALLDSAAARSGDVREIAAYRAIVLDALKAALLDRIDREGPASAATWLRGVMTKTADEGTVRQLEAWLGQTEAAIKPPAPAPGG
jgi:tetratricopeptide (TPR) repeat protein